VSDGPIFIAGLERSGTSLIYALLASHPRIAMTRRTNFWTYFYNQYGDLGEVENFDRCMKTMLRYKRLLPLKLEYDRVWQQFWRGETSYARLFSIIEEQYAERMGKPRWGDKSLNIERYADPIFDAYPTAKILHMVRDPRDRYASALTRWKVSRGGIGAGTAVWLQSMRLANRNRSHYPENYMIVRYETLSFQPEETLVGICSFIGEEYTPRMLSMDGAQTFRDEGGNSSYGQLEPGHISTKSIGRYKTVLSRRQIAFMQKLAGLDMMALGYSMEPVHLSVFDRLIFSTIDLPLNITRMQVWNLVDAYHNHTGRSLPSYRIVSEAQATNAGS
jgi:hypothetical protein